MEFHDFSISGRFFLHFPRFPWFLPDGGLPVAKSQRHKINVFQSPWNLAGVAAAIAAEAPAKFQSNVPVEVS